jgi:hypothetical protein
VEHIPIFSAFSIFEKKYAIVRTISVRPSVHQKCYYSFMAQSISYGPMACTKEGFFVGPVHSEQIPYKRVVKNIFGHFSTSFGLNCIF